MKIWKLKSDKPSKGTNSKFTVAFKQGNKISFQLTSRHLTQKWNW